MKKFLSLFCIFLICVSTAFASQEDYVVKDFEYTGYKLMETAAVSDEFFQDAVFIGDSLMVSIENRRVLKQANFLATIGCSIKSATTSRIFQHKNKKHTLEEMLTELNPNKIYVMLGSNSLCVIKAEEALEDYKALLDKIKETSPNAVIFIMSVPLMRDHAFKKYGKVDTMKGRFLLYNKGLKELALEYNAYYMEISELLVAGKHGVPVREYYTGDGIHLSVPGAERVRDYVKTHTYPDLDQKLEDYKND